METLFPGDIEVRYYDTLASEVRATQEDRLQLFEQRRWPYPISLVDGEIASIGSLNTFALIAAARRARQRREDETGALRL